MQNIPVVDNTWVNPYPKHVERLQLLADDGNILNVLLSGPTGSGKTTFAEQVAALRGSHFYLLEGGTVADSEQMFGSTHLVTTPEGPKTEFRLSEFMESLQIPNAVICIDEVNRFQSVRAQNALFGLLGFQRQVQIQETGQVIKVAPGVILFATINEGTEYSSTDALDLALRNRFSRALEMEFLPMEDEVRILRARTGADDEMARLVVRAANVLRGQYPISLRQMQAACEELLLGAEGLETFVYTFGSVAPEDIIRAQTVMVIG